MLLICAYLGFNYFGFQIQPDKPTIQFFLKMALKKVELPPRFRYMSRTDKGVSATSQLISFKKDTVLREELFERINIFLPEDIRIYGYATEGSIYKNIKEKEYLYVLRAFPDIDEDLLYTIISYMSDRTLNYYFFVKRPTITLNNKALWKKYSLSYTWRDEYILIKVRGKKFYWEQIRRMVTLIISVARGIIPLKRAQEILLGKKPKAGIPPAPPEGLILWDVSFYKTLLFKYILNPQKIKNWVLSEVIKKARNLRWVFPPKE